MNANDVLYNLWKIFLFLLNPLTSATRFTSVNWYEKDLCKNINYLNRTITVRFFLTFFGIEKKKNRQLFVPIRLIKFCVLIYKKKAGQLFFRLFSIFLVDKKKKRTVIFPTFFDVFWYRNKKTVQLFIPDSYLYRTVICSVEVCVLIFLYCIGKRSSRCNVLEIK
jgi:hypothetical protein